MYEPNSHGALVSLKRKYYLEFTLQRNINMLSKTIRERMVQKGRTFHRNYLNLSITFVQILT